MYDVAEDGSVNSGNAVNCWWLNRVAIEAQNLSCADFIHPITDPPGAILVNKRCMDHPAFTFRCKTDHSAGSLFCPAPAPSAVPSSVPTSVPTAVPSRSAAPESIASELLKPRWMGSCAGCDMPPCHLPAWHVA